MLVARVSNRWLHFDKGDWSQLTFLTMTVAVGTNSNSSSDCESISGVSSCRGCTLIRVNFSGITSRTCKCILCSLCIVTDVLYLSSSLSENSKSVTAIQLNNSGGTHWQSKLHTTCTKKHAKVHGVVFSNYCRTRTIDYMGWTFTNNLRLEPTAK